MQFTRNLKTLKIYALTILILSLAISTSAKNLYRNITKASPFKKSANATNTTKIDIATKTSQNQTSSFLQSKEEMVQFAPSTETKYNFDKYLAVKILLDIGRYIVRNFQNHINYIAYNKCIGSIKDDLINFESHLKLFWSEMYKISKSEEAVELKNKEVITNIFKKLYDKNVNLENPKIEKKCKSVLIIQPKILRKDLNTVLTRSQYFGGVASLRQKPFIDSMFSIYRGHLPPNAFEMLNKSSRGLESFKINSEGLTEIAIATPAELKKSRSAKKPLYAIEENYFGKIPHAKFYNSTANSTSKNSTLLKKSQNFIRTSSTNNSNLVTRSQKIHVLNNNNINFPGEPRSMLENNEVSFDPKAAGKNIVIERRITYPKTVEKEVINELGKSNLLPGLSGQVVNKTESGKGQEEIFVHTRNEAENAPASNEPGDPNALINNNVNNNSVVNNNGRPSQEQGNDGEMGVNEESDQ